MDYDKLLNEQEAAAILSVTVHCLRAWRWRKEQGPRYLKVGTHLVRYRPQDLQAYLESRVVDVSRPPRQRRARRAA
jgi:hypothetical protein